MGIAEYGVPDSTLLRYLNIAIQMNAKYNKLGSEISALTEYTKLLDDNHSDGASYFKNGYKDGGKSYTDIMDVLNSLQSVVYNLGKKIDEITTECAKRAKFYDTLKNNINNARSEVERRYAEKEYKSDWRLAENAIIAAQNNGNEKKKSDVRFNIIGSDVEILD